MHLLYSVIVLNDYIVSETVSLIQFLVGSSAFIRYDWVYAFVPAKREEDRHCRLVHKFSENVIKQRRKEMESGIEKSTSKKYLDFIDVLLAAKVHLLSA